MRNSNKSALLVMLLLVMGTGSYAQVKTSATLSSPDKRTKLEIGVKEDGNPVYRVWFAGKEIIQWSDLGFVTDLTAGGERTTMKGKASRNVREQFAWPLGENDIITNHYNETTLTCTASSLQYDLIARVFDGSVAFRYAIPEQSGKTVAAISKENTRFNFTTSYTLYQYNQESVFTPVSIDTFTNSSDLPATLTNGQYFVSIGEADNRNYTKAELKKGESAHSLGVYFMRDATVKVTAPYQTPWRTISIATSAIGLHAFSQLYLKLATPAATAVPDWIKPGKLIRAQLNTQSGLDCIDFAAAHNFQYIMFDAGWYGAEFRSSSDPTQVIPQIDMQKVIQYGKEKGIGVILYVNYVGLRAKLDTILPLYKQWGVKGMKFGFVDGLKQDGLTWLSAAMKKVYDHGFILDIHDNYKPTGLSRTYPNLLTQEGIRGDENSPDAFHTTTLPFTRFLAGPADFTFCYPNEKNSYAKNLKVSKAQQLALTVVYCSPLQAIFWYGQPKDYTNEGEIEFFAKVPTVWNESHYLAGDIGKNISVARRKGTVWYMGNVAGPEDWNGSIKLDFLSKGKQYTATIYEDDGQGSIRKRTLPVKKGDQFSLAIKAKGGQAVIIE
jgi:alpha-glucosidase